MRSFVIAAFFLSVLSLGCASAPKEKIGPISGKSYDCKKPADAAEYEKECKTDERNKCMARIPGLPDSDRRLIDQGRIAIGMTRDEVRCSYGEPAQVNRSETRGGVFEQWIYGETQTGAVYLYFQNGILLSSHDG